MFLCSNCGMLGGLRTLQENHDNFSVSANQNSVACMVVVKQHSLVTSNRKETRHDYTTDE